MSWLYKILGINLPSADEYEKQLLAQQQEEVAQAKILPDSPIATLKLTLCKNGDTNVECQWLEESAELARAYGQFLYYVNSGDLKTTIAETLISYSNNNVCGSEFVEQIINGWQDTHKQISDMPIISPSNVFGMGKQENNE